MMMWVFNRPEVAPAFTLARAGYDVWMGNNRGNRWSLGHKTLDTKDKAYWDFDWEDMGVKDTPAVIDFILKETGHEKLSYAGHSEGTTQIMAGASLLPDYYKSKVKVALLLSPVASLKNNHLLSLNIMALPVNRVLIESLLTTLGVYSLLPYNYAASGVFSFVCDLFDGTFCNILMALFTNEDPSIDYTERFDTYMSFLPAGAGYRNLIHYG